MLAPGPRGQKLAKLRAVFVIARVAQKHQADGPPGSDAIQCTDEAILVFAMADLADADNQWRLLWYRGHFEKRAIHGVRQQPGLSRKRPHRILSVTGDANHP